LRKGKAENRHPASDKGAMRIFTANGGKNKSEEKRQEIYAFCRKLL